MREDVRNQLRILWETEGYTPHAVAAHPDVPGETVATIQSALIQMSGDSTGKALLADLSIKGFEAAMDSQWDDVRALGIGLLQAPVKE